jgi:hypothetical protein
MSFVFPALVVLCMPFVVVAVSASVLHVQVTGQVHGTHEVQLQSPLQSHVQRQTSAASSDPDAGSSFEVAALALAAIHAPETARIPRRAACLLLTRASVLICSDVGDEGLSSKLFLSSVSFMGPSS